MASTTTTNASVSHLRYYYRADITVDGILLNHDSFIGLNEIYNYMEYLFPLRILMVRVNSTVFSALKFIDNNTCTIDITMYQIEKSDEEVPKTDASYVYNEEELYTATFVNCIVDQEIMPFSDEDVQTMNEKSSGNDMTYMIRFHLGEDYPAPFTAGIYNAILDQSCSPASIIADAFMHCSDPNLSLYMDPPSSDAVVPSGTVIRPMGFLQVIDFLQDLGMYPIGCNVFVEDGQVSVISKDGGIRTTGSPEPDFIIKVVHPMSMNVISAGLRPGYENEIILSSHNVIINDSLSVYYHNNETRITETGDMIHPNTMYKNASYVVNNDSYVSNNMMKVDEDIRMQIISMNIDKAYFDVDGTSVVQLESSHYTLTDLTVRYMKRIITPMGCMTNLVLHRKISE